MTDHSSEWLRAEILKLLHKTEGCDECKSHYKPPHKCDMDLAAPRCVARVKGLEKLFEAELSKAEKRGELRGRIDEANNIPIHADSKNIFIYQERRIAELKARLSKEVTND